MTDDPAAEKVEIEVAPCWGCVGKCSFCTVNPALGGNPDSHEWLGMDR